MRLALLGLWIGLLCGGCGAEDRPPILVVGIDGLEWSVLEPLMQAGGAPHFRTLVERGVAGSLGTQIPTVSPILWTTIATGMERREHGIRDFGEPIRNERGDLTRGRPYTSNSRRVPAIWNIAANHDRSVLAVAWWVSWPAEPVPGGRIVASYSAQVQGKVLWKPGVWQTGLPELTWPATLQDEIRPIIEQGEPSGPLRAEFESHFGSDLPDGPGWTFPRARDQLFHLAYHGSHASAHHAQTAPRADRRPEHGLLRSA